VIGKEGSFTLIIIYWAGGVERASWRRKRGSTAVPGLAAKPIMDVSVVVGTESDVPAAIERLATLGYVHQGEHDIDGYVEGKTDLLVRILRAAGLPAARLAEIERANRKPA